MPPRPPLRMILVTFIGAFTGMSLVALLETLYPSGWMLTIGSFGATAVLLYAIPGSALAQPRIYSVATLSLRSRVSSSITPSRRSFFLLPPWLSPSRLPSCSSRVRCTRRVVQLP
jgi:hypothetical protein